MTFPRTREEYTLFAIEWSGRGFEFGFDEINQYEKWLCDTVLRFPDLVEVTRYFSDYAVTVAGVGVCAFSQQATTSGSRSTKLLHALYCKRKRCGQVTRNT